jgi:type IV pilus biogenesis protein PilP
MQNRSIKFLLSALAAVAVMGANAAEPNSTQQIQAITERTAVLEAQLKELELRNRVEKATAERAQRDATASRTSPTLDAGAGTPVVSHVEGRKDTLEALLIYPNGAKQRVRTGDSLYGAVVQKIALNEVLLLDVKAKSTVRLQFASAHPQAVANGQSFPMPQNFGGPVPPVVIPQVPR